MAMERRNPQNPWSHQNPIGGRVIKSFMKAQWYQEYRYDNLHGRYLVRGYWAVVSSSGVFDFFFNNLIIDNN